MPEEIPMTQTFKIAAIPADGVGKEVVAAGRRRRPGWRRS